MVNLKTAEALGLTVGPVAGLCRYQTPRADNVVGESVPQRDGLDLVHAAHKKLRQPAIRAWALAASRSSGRNNFRQHLHLRRFELVPVV